MAPVVDVAIIGAGAAGLTAALQFANYSDVSFAILEAGPVLGGRLHKLEGFADFPIDVGGEWIHVDPEILNELAANVAVTSEIQTVPYVDTYYLWTDDDGSWNATNYGQEDYKFVDYTWFDFFNDYIAPDSKANIVYDCQVNSVDWSSTPVQLACADGRQWSANHVIVTASMKILQDGDLGFQPALPEATQSAINQITFATGLKVFMKFKTNFYKGLDAFARQIDNMDEATGERMYYDETYGQNSDLNILGIFAVGSSAEPYVNKTDQEIVQMILSELDNIFDGQATGNYTGEYFVQNWAKQPFVRGAYSYNPDDDQSTAMYTALTAIDELRKPLDNKIFFAGEAIPADNYEYGFAHGAARSGRFAAEHVLAVLESGTSDGGSSGGASGGETNGETPTAGGSNSTTGGQAASGGGSSAAVSTLSAIAILQGEVIIIISIIWMGIGLL